MSDIALMAVNNLAALQDLVEKMGIRRYDGLGLPFPEYEMINDGEFHIIDLNDHGHRRFSNVVHLSIKTTTPYDPIGMPIQLYNWGHYCSWAPPSLHNERTFAIGDTVMLPFNFPDGFGLDLQLTPGLQHDPDLYPMFQPGPDGVVPFYTWVKEQGHSFASIIKKKIAYKCPAHIVDATIELQWEYYQPYQKPSWL